MIAAMSKQAMVLSNPTRTEQCAFIEASPATMPFFFWPGLRAPSIKATLKH
jgi:hypothetical protein